jgi:predicted Zn-dependent peptidase
LSGTEETVRSISRSDLIDHWRRHYRPSNMLVSCAGGIDADAAFGLVRSAFRPSSGRVRTALRRAPKPSRGPLVRLLPKDTEQAHLCLGTSAIPRTHPHRFALELLHTVLGANMSSRLFREVREKRGLAYEIGTYVKRYHDTGAFVVSAGCDPGKLTPTVETVMRELRRVRRDRVAPSELRRAKEFYRGQFLLALEDSLDMMLWLGEHAVLVDTLGRVDRILEGIERVTAEDIQAVARRLFRSDRLALAVIGPLADSQAADFRALCRLP